MDIFFDRLAWRECQRKQNITENTLGRANDRECNDYEKSEEQDTNPNTFNYEIRQQ